MGGFFKIPKTQKNTPHFEPCLPGTPLASMQHETQQREDDAPPPVDVANEQQVASFLRSRIRVFPNFPRPGVDFSDVTTLLLDPVAFQLAIDALRHRYTGRSVTHVVSCESRGFIFGAPLALALQVAFVPVRRARRLPGNTVGVDYTSGFYTGRMEIHEDAIQKGGRVVVIDDLVATVCVAIDSVCVCGCTSVLMRGTHCTALGQYAQGHVRAH